MGSVIKQFVAGTVSVTVWANSLQREGREVLLHNVSVARNYRDRAGAVQTTSSLRPNDIPALMVALGRAYTFLLEREHVDARPGGRTEVGG